MGKAAAWFVATLFILAGAGAASAQECPGAGQAGPNTPSRTQTLAGRLIYHDGIRHWFELKLDRAQCGESSVELTEPDPGPKSLERLRGCRVESTGQINFSPTGYYSLDLYQDATRLSPTGACSRKPLLADYSRARPDPRVRAYRVTMDVDYRPGDHPIMFHVRSGHRDLHPWQAYAKYWLTGGFVLYGECGHGFVVDKVYGPAAASPAHFGEPRDPGDMAAFDPETPAEAGQTDLHLGYTCVRGKSG